MLSPFSIGSIIVFPTEGQLQVLLLLLPSQNIMTCLPAVFEAGARVAVFEAGAKAEGFGKRKIFWKRYL